MRHGEVRRQSSSRRSGQEQGKCGGDGGVPGRLRAASVRRGWGVREVRLRATLSSRTSTRNPYLGSHLQHLHSASVKDGAFAQSAGGQGRAERPHRPRPGGGGRAQTDPGRRRPGPARTSPASRGDDGRALGVESVPAVPRYGFQTEEALQAAHRLGDDRPTTAAASGYPPAGDDLRGAMDPASPDTGNGS